jgi:hypothetical protein
VVALAAGIAVALLGLVVPALRWLYDYAWFVGFGVAGAVYVMLMQRAEAPAGMGGRIMIATDATVSLVSFYINGAWERPMAAPVAPSSIRPPAPPSPKCPTPTPRCRPRRPRRARGVSQMARRSGGGPRAGALPLQGAARKARGDLAATLTRENGKTADDAKAEVRRAIQMVEVACGMPSLMMGDSLNDVAAGIDCKTIRQPIGVCAGITPFNFPPWCRCGCTRSPSPAATRSC